MGVSREGTALFRRGLREPPMPYPPRFPPGCPPVRRESPERAEPSLVGVWGNPPSPTRPASRQGSERVPEWERAHSRAPLRIREPEGSRAIPVRRESPERAEPSLVGVGGYPPTLPAPLPAREAGRTSGFGRDAQPCAPTESREPELEGQAAASARMRSQTCRASSRRPSPAGRLGGRT